ncbi:MAG: molybdopterin-binding protein [Rhodanobacteraceae bacterium]
MTDRRSFLRTALAGLGGSVLAGCDRLSQSQWWPSVLGSAETVNRHVQRALARHGMAREYSPEDIAPHFKGNGSIHPGTQAYRELAANQFRDWQLEVGGAVRTPLRLSLQQLRALPSRTQITRHDCVEGWSCIGQWTGVPLSHILTMAGPTQRARYVVFHCADELGGPGQPYYESIDLLDAWHPQTILAYALNGQPLPVANGAPLRLRVERQLGYKMAKYLMRIEMVEDFSHIHGGAGGFWEDRGYNWYAGI